MTLEDIKEYIEADACSSTTNREFWPIFCEVRGDKLFINKMNENGDPEVYEVSMKKVGNYAGWELHTVGKNGNIWFRNVDNNFGLDVEYCVVKVGKCPSEYTLGVSGMNDALYDFVIKGE
jgi:hypothetical protein